jgi:hypothetical protein
MSRRSLDRKSSGMAIKDVSVVPAYRGWANIKLAAPLPLTSLSDDVAALNRSLSPLTR